MRFPFISRAAHEAALSGRVVLEHTLRDEIAYLRSQLADMTARYHMLRLQGQAAPDPTPAPPPTEPERDPVMDAINSEANGDPLKRAMMIRQLHEDRRNQIPDEEIIAAIRRGVTVDDGVPI